MEFDRYLRNPTFARRTTSADPTYHYARCDRRPPVHRCLRWTTYSWPSIPTLAAGRCCLLRCPVRARSTHIRCKKTEAFFILQMTRHRFISYPLSTEPSRPAHQICRLIFRKANTIHRKLDTNIGVHSRMKPASANTPPSCNSFATLPSTNTQSVSLPLRQVEARAEPQTLPV